MKYFTAFLFLLFCGLFGGLCGILTKVAYEFFENASPAFKIRRRIHAVNAGRKAADIENGLRAIFVHPSSQTH